MGKMELYRFSTIEPTDFGPKLSLTGFSPKNQKNWGNPKQDIPKYRLGRISKGKHDRLFPQ